VLSGFGAPPPPITVVGGCRLTLRELDGTARAAPAPARRGSSNCYQGQNSPPAPLVTDFSCHQGQNTTFLPLAATLLVGNEHSASSPQSSKAEIARNRRVQSPAVVPGAAQVGTSE